MKRTPVTSLPYMNWTIQYVWIHFMNNCFLSRFAFHFTPRGYISGLGRAIEFELRIYNVYMHVIRWGCRVSLVKDFQKSQGLKTTSYTPFKQDELRVGNPPVCLLAHSRFSALNPTGRVKWSAYLRLRVDKHLGPAIIRSPMSGSCSPIFLDLQVWR